MSGIVDENAIISSIFLSPFLSFFFFPHFGIKLELLWREDWVKDDSLLQELFIMINNLRGYIMRRNQNVAFHRMPRCIIKFNESLVWVILSALYRMVYYSPAFVLEWRTEGWFEPSPWLTSWYASLVARYFFWLLLLLLSLTIFSYEKFVEAAQCLNVKTNTKRSWVVAYHVRVQVRSVGSSVLPCASSWVS